MEGQAPSCLRLARRDNRFLKFRASQKNGGEQGSGFLRSPGKVELALLSATKAASSHTHNTRLSFRRSVR